MRKRAWWIAEAAGVALVAGGVGLVWTPAALVLVGLYVAAAANVRGR
jgi:hypothetical protein